MTLLQRSADFQRAYVAVRYYLGARGAELTLALEEVTPAAASVAHGLAAPDQAERAQLLALELSRIGNELELRGLLA